MKINLMYNASDMNVLGKSLTTQATLDGVLKAPTDVVNPYIKVKMDDNLSHNINYCYIPQLGRYYFITDITSIRNGLWGIQCHCDVLETYKAQLKNLSGVVARQEFNYNLMLDDGTLITYANPKVQLKNFSQSFSNKGHSYVVVALGD